MTLGPFFINDLPGTATTQASLGYFNTATAVSRATSDIFVSANAHAVGIFCVSDATRTAGTATCRVRANGSGSATLTAVIDGTHTTSHANFVANASGVAITAGQTVGCEVVTSSWTPTTADVDCWVTLSFDAL